MPVLSKVKGGAFFVAVSLLAVVVLYLSAGPEGSLRLRDIPNNLIVMACGNSKQNVADINMPYNSTDVVLFPWLSFTRLTIACTPNTDTWVIGCEHGGRGHSTTYSLIKKGTKGIWNIERKTVLFSPEVRCSTAIEDFQKLVDAYKIAKKLQDVPHP